MLRCCLERVWDPLKYGWGVRLIAAECARIMFDFRPASQETNIVNFVVNDYRTPAELRISFTATFTTAFFFGSIAPVGG